MQSATAAIRAAYRTALDRIRSARRAQFEIPGDMGPRADLVPAAVPASVTPNWVNSAAPLGVPTPAGSIPPAAALPEPFAAGPAAAPIPEPVVANPAAAPMSEALGANPAPPAPAPAPAAPSRCLSWATSAAWLIHLGSISRTWTQPHPIRCLSPTPNRMKASRATMPNRKPPKMRPGRMQKNQRQSQAAEQSRTRQSQTPRNPDPRPDPRPKAQRRTKRHQTPIALRQHPRPAGTRDPL